MKKMRTMIVDLATVLTALAAIIVAGVVVVRQYGSRPPTFENRRVVDWERYAVGHRKGPEDAKVTIVEWGDYQCPVCRGFHPLIDDILSRYPEDVAFIYRHWPLTIHQFAEPAARAAECAGDQGRFFAYHDILYQNGNWLGDAFSRFAEQAGVGDLEAFRECISDGRSVESIQRDVEAVTELGGRGTPTVMINGTHLGGVLDAERIEREVQQALAEAADG